MKNRLSFLAVIVSMLLMFYLVFFYYPKWNNGKGYETTISWDVSGYYMYLPAIFIYEDIKECKFKDDILNKYRPTPDFQQGLKMDNGNYVMKYPIGQAIQYSPFFFVAHCYASYSNKFEADGFSRPYQFFIALESFLIAVLGLFVLRLILLKYFKDKIVGLTILAFVVGSNYLTYTTMSGAMTHNNLFTIYALLILVVIKFYEKPRFLYAVAIGALVGLATLTRVTELISLLIPFLWGILPNKKSIRERIEFFKSNFKYLISAAIVTILVGSIQLIYWKYVSGDWFVYSYDDQGFDFLKPHLWLGIFSYRSGWLVYSPMMLFALIGFYHIYKNYKNLFLGTFVFSIVFIYLTFAWNIWWYGGSVGIRAMVQSYPILAFPFAAFTTMILKRKYLKYLFMGLFIIFSYYNIWITHQAHKGGLILPGYMTNAYFWKVLGRYEKVENDLKLLDTKEEYTGIRENVELVYKNDFENDSLLIDCGIQAIEGDNSLCLNANYQTSESYYMEIKNEKNKWLRASADFMAPQKEWVDWNMTQFILTFYNETGEVIKDRRIKVHRFLSNNQTRNIYLDAKVPDMNFVKVGISFWNSQGQKQILIDNIKLELYEGDN